MVKKDMNVLVVGYNRATGETELLGVDETGGLIMSGSSEPIQTIGTSFAAPDAAPVIGQSKIAVTGTAVRITATSTSLPGALVMIRCDSENAGPITVGGSAVTNTVDGTGNGTVLRPGDVMPFFVSDLNQLYVNGTANYVFSWSAG